MFGSVFTPFQSHGDGHLGVGDRVHGAEDEGRVQGQLPSERTFGADLVRREVDVAGENDEIVVRDSTAAGHQLGP